MAEVNPRSKSFPVPSSEPADDIRPLLEENSRLRADLDRSTAMIMNLKGQHVNITDDQVETRFVELCTAIETWVLNIQRELRQFGWDFQYIVAESFEKKSAIGQAFANPSPVHGCSPLPILLDTSGTSGVQGRRMDWLAWLNRRPTCIRVVLINIIWTFIDREIMSRRLPVGVLDAFGDVLDEMMEATKDRIEVACSWKANTMAELIKTDKFRKQRNAKLERLNDDLCNGLASWPFQFLGRSPPPEFKSCVSNHLQRLAKDILRRAVDLHRDMSCSRFSYLVEMPAITPDMELPAVAERAKWVLRNIDDWTEADSDDEENIAGVYTCLLPGVVRCEMDGQEQLAVVRPTVLIHFDKNPRPRPSHRQPGASPSLGSSSEKPASPTPDKESRNGGHGSRNPVGNKAASSNLPRTDKVTVSRLESGPKSKIRPVFNRSRGSHSSSKTNSETGRDVLQRQDRRARGRVQTDRASTASSARTSPSKKVTRDTTKKNGDERGHHDIEHDNYSDDDRSSQPEYTSSSASTSSRGDHSGDEGEDRVSDMQSSQMRGQQYESRGEYESGVMIAISSVLHKVGI